MTKKPEVTPIAPAERPAFDDELTHLPIVEEQRPKTYGDCLREGWGEHDATGPCPWVSCAHHLVWGRARPSQRWAEPGSPAFIEAIERIELDDMQHTCALRAANDPMSLADIAEVFDVSRERVRQIESECFARLSKPHHARALGRSKRDHHELLRPELHLDFIHNHNALDRAIFEASRASNDNGIPVRREARVLAGEERAARIAELRARTSPRTTRYRSEEHAEDEDTLADPSEAAGITHTIVADGDRDELAHRPPLGPLTVDEIV